jgi:protein KRI1
MNSFDVKTYVLESSEDEDAEELTEEVERDFFKTLAMLKSKDPRIYDNKTTFFASTKSVENVDSDSVKKKTKKDKPMTIGDLERQVMLEKGGKYEEMDEFKPTTRYDKTN